MAMTKCKECGNEISTKADACPKCGAKQVKTSGCAWIALSSIIFFVFLGVVGQCSRNDVPDNSSATTNIKPTSAPSNSNIPTALAEATTVPTSGGQWSYVQDADPMGKGTAYQAYVSSSNTAEFDFPYAGSQHATLTLRSHPRNGKDVIFSIERGQFLCPSYEGCSALVRFDDEKAATYSALGTADNSTETIFIQNYSRFVEKLSKANRVRISANIYQEGAPVFEFDVTGFDAHKYVPIK